MLVMVKMNLGIVSWDLVEKKLDRCHNVVFFENKTIEDLEKVKKVDSQINKSLVFVDPISLTIAP